ncbi:MAG: glutamate mutase L [Actinomycetia bacterium]|nr:glutamate mutase L [Actinomycetes bacterium]
MLGIALLIDFGSTFTKLVAIDLEKEIFLGSSYYPTTVETDVMIGFQDALDVLNKKIFKKDEDYNLKLACSSAAGGLGIVAIGLVPILTSQAAKIAALGAGGKVLKVYSFKLTSDEREEIENLKPDLILLSGGTDGGNEDVILHNAEVISQLRIDVPIVYAGNKCSATKTKWILERNDKSVSIIKNILPELNNLNIEPVQGLIRKLFLSNIIKAKGISKRMEFLSSVLMPTPSAVLKAGLLLSKGTDGEEGIGDLMLIDVGGATTDVCSYSFGIPGSGGFVMKGLPQPYTKRTVEGDLGIRYSAKSLLNAAKNENYIKKWKIEIKNLDEKVDKLSKNIDFIAENENDINIDELLSKISTRIAVNRHAGKFQTKYTPMGSLNILYGKDLRDVPIVLGTGGGIVKAKNPKAVLEKSIFGEDEPFILKPKSSKFLLDKDYIMFAIGLLSQKMPDLALRLLKKHLVYI